MSLTNMSSACKLQKLNTWFLNENYFFFLFRKSQDDIYLDGHNDCFNFFSVYFPFLLMTSGRISIR